MNALTKLALRFLPPWLGVTIAVLVLAGIVFGFVVKVIRVLAKTATATKRVVELAQNRNSRKGRVIAMGDLLRTPFGGRECVMYEVEILRIYGDPICDRKMPNFLLENDSGRVWIYGNDVCLENKFDLVLDDPDPKYKAVLEHYGIDYHDWQVHKVIRCQERYIAPGQEVELSGFFQVVEANPPRLQRISDTTLVLKA
ncbi:MAG TPA: hypothetical protein PK156_31170 [Polyangium sp.]|nr:hypothetical protein [Polyangium sp.]